MKITNLLILEFVLAARLTGAQNPTGIAVVDSANVARAAWARAAAALQQDDTSKARVEITRAADSWPTQPAYVWARAVIAAHARDKAAALDALRQYSSLGLGRDLRAEKSFEWLRESPEFATLAAEHDANRRPLSRSRVVAALPDSTFWPEGVDVDVKTRRFYVTSIRHRTIAEVRPDGSTREVLARGRRDLGAILGVRVDAARGELWATTSPVRESPGFADGDTTTAELLRIDIASGRIVKRWRVPSTSGAHTLGDLAIGPRGDVFLTDSGDPVLYRLRPGADTLEAIRNPLFRSLQGIAPLPIGDVLFVADYSHGLLRVDVETRVVERLIDAPKSTSVGCDGIAWDPRSNAIIAVQNGVSPARVMRFVVDPAGQRITQAQVIDRSEAADEPTIGAIVGREFVYVANSQWEKHDGRGRRLTARPLTAPVLLAVPLP
jgi:DNA-binding beta-propeller fold protein YncE